MMSDGGAGGRQAAGGSGHMQGAGSIASRSVRAAWRSLLGPY